MTASVPRRGANYRVTPEPGFRRLWVTGDLTLALEAYVQHRCNAVTWSKPKAQAAGLAALAALDRLDDLWLEGAFQLDGWNPPAGLRELRVEGTSKKGGVATVDVSGCAGLEVVDVRGARVVGFAALPALELLDIGVAEDLDEGLRCPQLEVLRLRGVGQPALRLGGWTSPVLRELDLRGVRPRDLGALASAGERLETLRLDGTEVAEPLELSTLPVLPRLRILWCRGVASYDASVLERLPRLEVGHLQLSAAPDRLPSGWRLRGDVVELDG